MAAKRPAAQPTSAEWKVLNALWQKHPASARELLEALETRWAYTTLKTILSRMEEKGLVRARMRGNTAWYEPAVERTRARKAALGLLLERVFEGAAGPLLLHLAENERLSPAERKKIARWAAELGAEDSRGDA
jgi:BlaI family penicillinase repressor